MELAPRRDLAWPPGRVNQPNAEELVGIFVANDDPTSHAYEILRRLTRFDECGAVKLVP